MAFFGSTEQASKAMNILTVLGQGAGGAGIFYLIARFSNWLLQR